MTKVPPWQLGFMFLCAAAIVLVMGYRYVGSYPVATTISGLILLAALGRWYVVARGGNDEVVNRTVRRLGLAIVALVLVVPYLLRIVLKP